MVFYRVAAARRFWRRIAADGFGKPDGATTRVANRRSGRNGLTQTGTDKPGVVELQAKRFLYPWYMRFSDRVGRDTFPGKLLRTSVTGKINYDSHK